MCAAFNAILAPLSPKEVVQFLSCLIPGIYVYEALLPLGEVERSEGEGLSQPHFRPSLPLAALDPSRCAGRGSSCNSLLNNNLKTARPLRGQGWLDT
ncbi:hypothetical protein Poly41_69480 [Novipirellula artificiosorum]|uniref:Uncharacterized protein n=1 Tax=Novipirellula artificiosorum TaxID=2528016 RepID=A0A5C6CUA9_9BACT|nr:hypothetical protein Poly41_69480 [Novipirellula artificiosorum]